MKSIILFFSFVYYFCQKIYYFSFLVLLESLHFYSSFLPENLLFPISLSARKCIISILCFCQKIYYFQSYFLPKSVSFLFFVSVRKSTIFNLTFCQKVYHFYSLFLSENHCSSSLMMNIFEIYFEHILLIYVTDFLVFLAKINLDIVI